MHTGGKEERPGRDSDPSPGLSAPPAEGRQARMIGHYTTGALPETTIDSSYLFLKVSQNTDWVSCNDDDSPHSQRSRFFSH